MLNAEMAFQLFIHTVSVINLLLGKMHDTKQEDNKTGVNLCEMTVETLCKNTEDELTFTLPALHGSLKLIVSAVSAGST